MQTKQLILELELHNGCFIWSHRRCILSYKLPFPIFIFCMRLTQWNPIIFPIRSPYQLFYLHWCVDGHSQIFIYIMCSPILSLSLIAPHLNNFTRTQFIAFTEYGQLAVWSLQVISFMPVTSPHARDNMHSYIVNKDDASLHTLAINNKRQHSCLIFSCVCSSHKPWCHWIIALIEQCQEYIP